jgi:ABC-type sugar transport system ATPase subunit
MLKASNIVQRYGSVTVLDNVNFDLACGEVHALFGANGAGKSTLSKMIAGHFRPSEGKLFLNEKEQNFRSPKEALEAGVAMVMQETSLAPDLSVLENLFLPLYGRKGRVQFQALREKGHEILQQLGVVHDIELRSRTGDLSAAHRQIIEIGRALALEARVIIFDEPTTSLSPSEVAKLFAVMNRLRADGCAMVFVSHRMEELFSITDRVTILRDGKIAAGGVATADLTQAELVKLMIGKELSTVIPRVDAQKKTELSVVLEVKHLKALPLVQDMSFRLHLGEILGLGGLVGAGRSETLEAIFGLRKVQEGQMYLNGIPYRPKRPLDAIHFGFGFVAEDRRAQSILPDLSVRENLMVAVLSAQKSPIARYQIYFEKAAELAEKLDLPSYRLDDDSMLGFSGGMQQKVLLMRWLLLEPRVLLLDEPTKGIDIGARSAIYAILREIAALGVSILVVSSDFEELIELCDRIVPVSDGRSIGAVPASLLDAQKLLMLAAPRSSTTALRSFLTRIEDKYTAPAFWAIVENGTLMCLASSSDSRNELGFSSGMICSVEQSLIPIALNSIRYGLVVEESGVETVLVNVTNDNGHKLGVIGIVFRQGVSPECDASIRVDLEHFVAEQHDEQINLSI